MVLCECPLSIATAGALRRVFDEASKPAIAGETDGRSRSLTPPKAQAQTLSDLIVRQQTERMDAMQACATVVPFRLRIRFILAPILQRHTRSSPLRSAVQRGKAESIASVSAAESLQRECLGPSAVSDRLPLPPVGTLNTALPRSTSACPAVPQVLTAAAEATGCAAVK